MYFLPPQTWIAITHLGAASIMLPMAAMIFIGFALAGRKIELGTWLLTMLSAIVIVLFSKIAFIGWGLGSAVLDFTGISGHAMLSSSVIPIWLGWLLASSTRRLHPAGVILGLMISALVAWSRVVLGAHSMSEVVIGWLLGATVSLVACRSILSPVPARYLALFSGLFLLFALNHSLSSYLPTQIWEIRAALTLSGHARPYTRKDLHRSGQLIPSASAPAPLPVIG
jgi:membrane-associated phospholipid phosphatase